MCNLRTLEAGLAWAGPQITGLPATSQVQLPKWEHLILALDSLGLMLPHLSDWVHQVALILTLFPHFLLIWA